MPKKKYPHAKDCATNVDSGLCDCGAQAASDYHDRAEARRAAMAPPKRKRTRKPKEE